MCHHGPGPPQPEEPRRTREGHAKAAPAEAAEGGPPGREVVGGELVRLHLVPLPGEHDAHPGALAGVANRGGVLIQSASKAAKQLRSQMTPPTGDVA